MKKLLSIIFALTLFATPDTAGAAASDTATDTVTDTQPDAPNQDVQFTLTVLDAETSRPITDAKIQIQNVTVQGEYIQWLSNGSNKGEYELKHMIEHNIDRIQHDSYRTKTFEINGSEATVSLDKKVACTAQNDYTLKVECQNCPDNTADENCSLADCMGQCVATECESGYNLENGKCICEPGYELKKGKCVSVNDTDCDDAPEHSKKSYRYYDSKSGQTLCIVETCVDGYKVSNDKLSCMLESALSDEDAEKRMDELKENAEKMKERENSTANKLLGATGMATVGAGGAMLASALSAQASDADAEQDMRAYLATFTCDYGAGRNIRGGETNIQLPGGNELIEYVTEYKQLAASLKESKAALGMAPGIESEVVFDSATTGLYDDVGIGTQKGAFTSLSRALMDANSADAAEWAAQKKQASTVLTIGASIAGAGIVGTAAANLAMNRKNGDQSSKIFSDYESKKQPTVDVTPERKPCPSGTAGKFIPNCICLNPNEYYSTNDVCMACGENQDVNQDKNGCECKTGYTPVENSNPLQCQQNAPGCDLTGYRKSGVCECQAGTTRVGDDCQCDQSGYIANESEHTCEKCVYTGQIENGTNPCKCAEHATPDSNNVCNCDNEYEPDGNNGCKPKQSQPATQPITFTATANADSTFGPGECKIDLATCEIIVNKLRNGIKQENPNYDEWKSKVTSATNIDIVIDGYTDRQGFQPNQNGKCLNRTLTTENLRNTANLNKKLSEERAKAMKKCIDGQKSTLFDNAKVNYTTNGKGQDACTKCDTDSARATVCDKCRRVDITISIQPESAIPGTLDE